MDHAREASATRALHVLVVDDMEIIRHLLEDMLTALGCTVDVFQSGEEVLDHVGGGAEFDLIMMDCQMPQMDGMETTRRLVEHHGDRPLQIVAMSAHCTEEYRRQQADAGMTEHLSKPFRLTDLKALLGRLG